MILKAVEKRGIIIETLPILDEVSLQSAHSTKILCSKALEHFFFLLQLLRMNATVHQEADRSTGRSISRILTQSKRDKQC